jgi:tRNA nucleotidyltransferase (CCA-adding enzyme)
LENAEQSLLATLPQCDRPSQVVQSLQAYDLETMVLVSVRHPRPAGKIIWLYLTTWAQIKAPLNGHDLKQLGYRQGPNFRVLLDELLWATLDGVVSDREQAIAYLAVHHPLH